ncbi:MAG: hypothetical protein WKF66_17555 [Pedobacter sp.]
MKAALRIIFAMLLLSTGLSCSKDDGYVENFNEEGLTPCPVNSNCQYLYTDNANFPDDDGIVGKGEFRIFSNRLDGPDGMLVYIKAPMKGNTFYIDNSDIQKDFVKIIHMCALCYGAPLSFKVTGGFSKGKKLIDLSGKEKWLLDTKLFYTIENTGSKDTLQVKQYYYPKP